MARINRVADRFIRSPEMVDYFDEVDETGKPSEDGLPAGYKENTLPDGTVLFSFLNNGQRIEYEVAPNSRKPRPTFRSQRLVANMKPGKRAPTSADGSPTGERERKPVQQPTQQAQPSQPSQPTQSPQRQAQETDADAGYNPGGTKTTTNLEAYLRLARHLIEG